MASIRSKVRADGTTVFHVIYRDPETRKQTSKTTESESEAILMRDFLNANGQSWTLAVKAVSKMRSRAPLVQELVQDHIANLHGVEQGTVFRYGRILQHHIHGTELGETRGDKLTVPQVVAWFDGLDRSPKTKRNIHALLSAALERAIKNDAIPKNPAKGIRPPKSVRKTREAVFLSPEEVQAIIDNVPEHFRLFIQFLYGTGLRFSEATALTKSDVKTRNGHTIVSVTKAWKAHAGPGVGQELGAPKTPKGTRNVTLSPTLATALRAHLATLKPGDLIFTNTTGDRLWNGAFHNDSWGPTIKKLVESGELAEKPVIHDLRHSHVSALLAAGVTFHVIQMRVGHEDISTTVGTYGMLANDADAQAASLLG